MAKVKQKHILAGWRILVMHIAPHRNAITLLSVLSLLSATTNAMVPYLAGKIIDTILDPRAFGAGFFSHIPLVFWFIIGWFIVYAVSGVMDWQIDIRSAELGGQLEGEYIVEGFSKVLRLPLSFHKKMKIGDVGNRISRAADWLANLAQNIVIRLAPQFLSIIFAGMFAFAIQPKLAIILLFAIVGYLLVMMRIVPEAASLSHRTHRAFNRAYGDAFDALLNTAQVKQANAENHERRKLSTSFFKRAFRFWFMSRRLWSLLNIWQRAFIAATQFLIFILGVLFIRAGSLTVGQLVMFNGYVAMLFGPFAVLGRNWETIQNGIASLERAGRMLETPEEVYQPDNAVILSDIKGSVEFRRVSFSYGTKKQIVLRDISFRVLPGERVALVGGSGVGKSTLIDLISYYFKPTSGSVLIDGHPINRLNLESLRSRIAVVPQEIILFNDTIKNNIRYGNFGATDEEITEASRKAHAHEFIESFPKKYNQIVGERGIKLSMGQKQRIAIARAVLRNPRILILDEPTSALDAQSERYIQESLRKLMQERTTFIIAHRLSTVREANAILVLDKGCVAEVGTHDELIKKENGIYRRLYELQIGFA